MLSTSLNFFALFQRVLPKLRLAHPTPRPSAVQNRALWPRTFFCLLAGLFFANPELGAAADCDLYPIALSLASLSNATPGTVLSNIYNGTASGTFGWLSWAGKGSAGALVQSLKVPGDSATYLNPDDQNDHRVSLGDWVTGSSGLSNARDVRDALDLLKQTDIRVPVWDLTRAQGNPSAYRVAGFALLRLLDYELANQNRISARFLGFVTCGAVNRAPDTDAGPDGSGVIGRVLQLEGRVTDDGLPALGALASTWQKLSGPGSVHFDNPSQPRTGASFSEPGTYLLELTAGDGELVARDQVTLLIQPANSAPHASDATVRTIEDTSIEFQLEAGDPDGDPLQYTILAGPAFGALEGSPPNLRYIPARDYSGQDTFTFQVNDGRLDSAVAKVNITITGVNDRPFVDAGLDQLIAAGEPASLFGFATDDATPAPMNLQVSWEKASGPGHVTFGNQPAHGSSASTIARFSAPGSYVLRLSADDSELSASDEVTIVVNAAPAVTGAPDGAIRLGEPAFLAGRVDDDGLPNGRTTASWQVVSGPGAVFFEPQNAETTTARFSSVGRYRLRLVGDDGHRQGHADSFVEVSPANLPPAISAPSRQVLRLPALLGLHAVVTDDGIPSPAAPTVAWTKLSGPGDVAFGDPSAADTSATFAQPGSYQVQCSASDGELSSSLTISVMVQAASVAGPLAVDAGPDQVVGLTSETSLAGIVSSAPDPGTLELRWEQISGPAPAIFASPRAARTTATFPEQGSYVLRFSAENNSQASSDDLTVIVYPRNQPPRVEAGPDAEITVAEKNILAANGFETADPADFLSSSLALVDHWNPAIGQPGLDGPVLARDLAAGGGKLYVSGQFESAGRTTVKGLAGWDGLHWFPLFDPRPSDPTNPNSSPIGFVTHEAAPYATAMAARGHELFVAGGFLKDLSFGEDGHLDFTARWTGQHWERWQFALVSPVVSCRVIAVSGEDVYVGGAFLFQPAEFSREFYPGLPISFNIARWNGQQWTTLGEGIRDVRDSGDPRQLASSFGSVNAIAVASDGDLYAAGSFTMQTPEGLAYHVARWDGQQWHPVGRGLAGCTGFNCDPAVSALVIAENGDLYAGGNFTRAGDVDARGIARWNGQEWSALAEPGSSLNGVDAPVEALALRGRDLYVAGQFTTAGPIQARRIAKWNGQTWAPLGTPDGADATITALALQTDRITAGGYFQSAGGSPANSIAQWEFAPLPRFETLLHGTATDDGLPLGSVLTLSWSKVSGPGQVEFSPADSGRTSAAFSEPGHYLLNLTATDSEFSASDQVEIEVHGNRPPEVDAGPDRAAGLNEVIRLAGAAGDDQMPAEVPLAIAWSVVRGPGQVSFANRSDPHTTASFSALGTYVLRLTANDSQFSATDDLVISVLPANQPPQVTLFAGQRVVLPAELALGALVADDHLPHDTLQAVWSQVSGPGRVLFANPSALSTSASFTKPGTYTIAITATDSELSARTETTVEVVDLHNAQPFVYAGPDRIVTQFADLPLAGLVIDDTPLSALTIIWAVWQAPGGVTFSDPASPTATARFDTPGVYGLTLYAIDFGTELFLYDEVLITVRPAGNQPPVVYAGPPRSISLGDPALVLESEVFDETLPGPLTTTWRSVQGPATVAFADSSRAATTATFTAAGQYLLELSASDGELTASAQVTITVSDPHQGNLPPSVDAGADQTVLVSSSLSLLGAAQDDGLPGLPIEFSWSQAAGPCPVIFANPDAAQTTVRFQTPGEYVLRLTATDRLLSNGDDLIVTVLPAPNLPPVVDPGGAQTLFLPANSLALNATVTDDGQPAPTAVIVTWSVLSGSGPVVFSDTHSLTPTVTFPNTFRGARYTLRLTATDTALTASRDTIITIGEAAVNTPPAVNAGPDQTITAPTILTLAGSVTDDGRPFHFTTATWSFLSGPCLPIFGNINQAATTAQFPLPGTYRLRLTANDLSLYASDDLTVVVLPANNAAPVVDAGPAATVLLSNPVLDLRGAASDDGQPAGSSLTVLWSVVEGPGPVLFAPPDSAATRATFALPGHYRLRLSAGDGDLTSSREVSVTVTDASIGNLPPRAVAGPDQAIDFPGTPILEGAALDDGLPGLGLQSQWSLVSGPSPVSFGDDFALATDVYFFAPGLYRLRLTVSDLSLSDSDDLLVDVRAGNQAPRVHAGFDANIFLPDTATLTGRAFDDGLPGGGNPLLLQWTQVSGPAPALLPDPASGVTTASFPQAGPYIFRLTASDGQLTGSDDVTINVIGGTANLAPLVDAGPDQAVFTVTPVQLRGAATDDGLPAGGAWKIYWSQVDGPAAARFDHAGLAEPSVRFFTPGTYRLRFSATDGQLTANDDVILTVAPPVNLAPMVLAGPDLQVTRPAHAALLGLVFDDALPLGYPLTTHWSKISGPGNVTFSPSSAEPRADAAFSEPGVYRLRLSADDSEFAVQDELTVTVIEGINQPPTISLGNAGQAELGQPFILPAQVADDGLPRGVLESGWSLVSGPATVSFSTLNGLSRAAFSLPGEYLLRMTANDSALTSTADLSVTVAPAAVPPVAVLTVPADGATVTAPTQVRGSVQSPSLESFTLEYRLASGARTSSFAETPELPWILLSRGTTAGSDLEVGAFDPTLLLNGIYELRLTARDQSGRSAESRVTVVVEGQMKIGRFGLSFTDLTVPVAGFPLQITRVYDSRDKSSGDFGMGWQLELKNIRLQKNRHLGRDWEETSSGGDFPTYCLDPGRPRIVTVTFPNGRVDRFLAQTDPDCSPLLPIRYPRVSFVPIGNTRSSLVPLTGDEVVFGAPIPGLGDLVDWELLLNPPPGAADNILFNPRLFELTTAEGYKFEIDEQDGLQRVTDPNGRALVITRDGITDLSGNGVRFERDAAGRITRITDPSGQLLSYHYDPEGNLARFEDQEHHLTDFSYDLRHGLLAIQDARGITPIRNEYDDSGRLVRHTDAFGKTVTYEHQLGTRQEIVTDRLGRPTVSEYDERGNVVKITRPDGSVVSATYDSRDNLLTETDPLGRTTTHTYDSANNRTSTADPAGQITRATYGPLRRITSIIDPRGRITTNQYDPAGNLLTITDPLGNSSSLEWENGFLKGFTDALGGHTAYELDSAGNLLKETDALGHFVTWTRDAGGNVLTQTATRTAANGSVETLTARFEYDRLGRPTNSIAPDGSSTKTIYNELGKPVTTIDPLGRQTSFNYDPLGQLVQITYPDGAVDRLGYDAQGRVIAGTNRLGQITRYEYDPVGRLIRAELPDGASISNYFDRAGQLIARTDPRGSTTFYGYDLAGRLVSWTNGLGQVALSEYDPAGNLIFQSDLFDPSISPPTPNSSSLSPVGERAGVRGNSYVYDPLNRLVQTIYPDGTSESSFYDSLSRRVAQVDQAGIPTWFGYDPLGRLTAVTNALGQVTSYRYDELGQLISQTDPNLHTTTYEYDLLGRRTRRTLPATAGQTALSETYAYDLAGNLASKTDFNGFATAYTYDALNRLLERRPDPRLAAAGSVSETWTYDALGRRASMTDAGGLTTYAYDQRNRLAEKTTPLGTLRYTHDPNGNVLTVQSSTPGGTALAYEYDALDRLALVRNVSGPVCSYAYHPDGALARYSYANGLTTEFTYDSLHRPLTIQTRNPSLAPAHTVSYTLGPAGNRLSTSETLSLAPLGERAGVRGNFYGYDPLYRLIQEHVEHSTGATESETGTLTYTYDPAGNRLSLNSSLPVLPSQTLAVDTLDRLTADRYDANGNTIQSLAASPGSALPAAVYDTYDFQDRLISRRASDSAPSLQFTYDGDGNRVRKTAQGATTAYLVDDLNPTGYPQVLEEFSGPAGGSLLLSRRYTWGHSLIAQEQPGPSGPQTSFYGYDASGSVRFLSDPAGALTDSYHYDAFGNLLSRTGTTPNTHLYRAQQFDPDLQLYYLRARYYNPLTGRFWSRDTFEGSLTDPSSQHGYLYSANNPVNRFDPSGHFSITEQTHVAALAPIVRGALLRSFGGMAAGAIFGAADASLNGYDPAMGAFMGAITGFGLGFVPGRILAHPAVIIAALSAGGLGVGESLYEGHTSGAAFRAALLAFPLAAAAQGTAKLTSALTEYFSRTSLNLPRAVLPAGLGDVISSPWLADPRGGVRSQLEMFRNGGSYLVPKSVYHKWIAGKQTVGRPDGQFLTTRGAMDDLLSKSNGNLDFVKAKLGIPPQYWNEPLYRVDVESPLLYNARMPSGMESGANSYFRWGGYTSGGMPEIATDVIPMGGFTVRPTGIGP